MSTHQEHTKTGVIKLGPATSQIIQMITHTLRVQFGHLWYSEL